MSRPRRDFERFVAETLLREFLESDLKALKSKEKADKDEKQQRRDKGVEDKGEEDNGKTPKMFKIPGASDKEDEEDEEEKTKGTIGDSSEKVENLRNVDQNWKQMVAYSKNATKLIKVAIAKMQADDGIRMKKAFTTSQRLMKTNMGKQYTRLIGDVGGDSLTAKVTLMQLIAQLIQDLEAGK